MSRFKRLSLLVLSGPAFVNPAAAQVANPDCIMLEIGYNQEVEAKNICNYAITVHFQRWDGRSRSEVSAEYIPASEVRRTYLKGPTAVVYKATCRDNTRPFLPGGGRWEAGTSGWVCRDYR